MAVINANVCDLNSRPWIQLYFATGVKFEYHSGHDDHSLGCYSVDKSIYHYDSGHDDPFLDCVIVLINLSTITIASMTIPS
jgi:hypothetical protein